MNRSTASALLVAVMLLACMPLVAHADDHYTITVENGEIGIPEQTTNQNGEEFTFSSVAPIKPGEEIDISISAPDNVSYGVYFIDENEPDLTNAKGFTGDSSTSYETDSLDPGTYSLIINEGEDGSYNFIKPAQPVVITAYETTVSAPESVSEDESFTVDISTTEHDDVDAPAIGTVDVVIADDTSTDRITATEDDANEAYTATVDSYDPGEYRLYVSVSASENPDGDSVDVISMSDERSLTVTEAETDDGNDGGGGGGGDGGDGGDGAGGEDGVDSDDGTTDDATDDEADTVDDEELNATDDGPDDADDVTNATDVGADGTDDTDGDVTSTGDDAADADTDGTTTDEDDDGVIRPQENSTATDTDEDASLGAVQLLLGAMMALGIVSRIRRDR